MVAPLALGLGKAAMGLVSMLPTIFFNKPEAEGPQVRLKASNPGDDNAEGGVEGNVATFYAWDVANNYLGKADGEDVDIGDTVDVTIDSSRPGSRADYVGVTMGDDAVCTAWITVSQFDGSPDGAWTGDVGKECGQDWYHNQEMAGYIGEEEDVEGREEYIPHCTWLDRDHSDDIPSATLKFSVGAYGSKVKDTVKSKTWCDFTAFGADDAPINAAPGAKKRALAKREEKRAKRAAAMPHLSRRLIVSDKGHTAASLCESETSWGPDFIGEDGQFCDMTTHELHPLCETEDVEGCVNIDENERQVKKRSTVAKRSIETVHKSYDDIKRWTRD